MEINTGIREKIYITRVLPEEAVTLLRLHYDVKVNSEDRTLSKEELINSIKDCDGVLCSLTDIIDKEVMDSCPKVKIFANYAVGYNNIDIAEADKRGIRISNTPDVLTNATADLAWALLFSAARRIVESDRYTRKGKFTQWSPTLFLGQEITGKTLGIIGSGRIGRAFGKKSKGFDMKVIYHSRRRDVELEEYTGASRVELPELLRKSDFVSIHVPLTNETKHMIGEKELKLMKNSAVLVNTSRGAVIDEKALAEALKNRTIYAAGLDVYENEPQIEEALMNLDNVVMVPHIGSATVDTRNKMALIAANNIIEVLSGREPITPVGKV